MHTDGVSKACPRRSLGSFRRGRDGTIAALLALLLAVLLGSVALSFDLGRAYDLHTEMQSAADAVALASGSQLDNQAGAVDRACRAGIGRPRGADFTICQAGSLLPTALAQNTQTFATDGQGNPVINFTVTFWQSLNKDVLGNLNQPATGDNNAEFVQVVATPRNVNFWFAGVVGALSTVPVGARAVAGYGASICQVPPMFVCQPPGGFTLADVGKGMWMKGQNEGGGTAWTGGNFGLLQLPGQGGLSTQAVSQAMGMVNPDAQCFGVVQETLAGQHQPIQRGLNTRFDIYEGPWVSRADPQFQPSRNSVKGMKKDGPNPTNQKCGLATGGGPGWAQPDNRYTGPGDISVPIADTMPFPRDTCAYLEVDSGPPLAVSCRPTGDGGRLGDAIWDIVSYMAVHHNGTPPNAPLDLPLYLSIDADPLYGDGNGRTTRWEVHKWELKADGTNKSQAGLDAIPDPYCYSAGFPGVPPANPPNDRKLLCIAIVDCTGLGAGGGQQVDIVEWLAFFLTEPVGINVGTENPDNKSIYAEFVGEDPQCSGPDSLIARRVVRLFE